MSDRSTRTAASLRAALEQVRTAHAELLLELSEGMSGAVDDVLDGRKPRSCVSIRGRIADLAAIEKVLSAEFVPVEIREARLACGAAEAAMVPLQAATESAISDYRIAVSNADAEAWTKGGGSTAEAPSVKRTKAIVDAVDRDSRAAYVVLQEALRRRDAAEALGIQAGIEV